MGRIHPYSWRDNRGQLLRADYPAALDSACGNTVNTVLFFLPANTVSRPLAPTLATTRTDARSWARRSPVRDSRQNHRSRVDASGTVAGSDQRRTLGERIQRVRSSGSARTEGKHLLEVVPIAGVEFDRRDTYPNVDIVIELQTAFGYTPVSS